MKTINYKGMKLYDGVLVKGRILSKEIKGKIAIPVLSDAEEDTKRDTEKTEMYFCQNEMSGADCGNKFGYEFSWVFGLSTKSGRLTWGVEIFEVLEEIQSTLSSKIDIKGERKKDTEYTDGIKINISN